MKKTRGFTLVECIVALAILGIASLVMAQIYAAVSQQNRLNHQNNASIANQMKYVEEKTDSEAIRVPSGLTKKNTLTNDEQKFGIKPISKDDSTKKHITLTRRETSTLKGERVYTYAVDYYVLQSRDQNDNAKFKNGALNADYQDLTKDKNDYSTDDKTESSQRMYLNYKYFTGTSGD